MRLTAAAAVLVLVALALFTSLAWTGGVDVAAAQVTAEPSGTPGPIAPDDDGDDARDWVAPVLVGGAAMLLATAFGGWYLVRRG